MLRYLTAGESHGQALVAILDGCPANLSLSAEDIDNDLARRQGGYGRGPRMKLEKDQAQILSGTRKGKTIGSPIAIVITNKSKELFDETFTHLRPGHADLAGALKYNQEDLRNILERSSARATAVQVGIGAIARKLLSEFKIKITSKVISLGGSTREGEWEKLIDHAREAGDSLGGIFEITAAGVPVGLGSYVQWDRRLSGTLAQAVMSVPGVKGVEFGHGFKAAELPGSKVHDEIFYDSKKGFYHKTNNAGGIEGGISNGEPIVIRAVMKPISTIRSPLQSVDLVSKEPVKAHVERADVSAVEAAGVVGEAAVAFELARAFLEKFGGDSLEETMTNFSAYQKQASVI